MRLIFSRPKNPKLTSKIIMYKLRTEYSHVAVEFELSKMNRRLIFQASHGDVHAITFNQWQKENLIVDQVYINIDKKSPEYTKIMQFLLDNLQKKYGYKAIMGILFNLKWLGVDGDDSFICSELVAEVLRILYNFDIGKKVDYITPKDIQQIIDNLEGK